MFFFHGKLQTVERSYEIKPFGEHPSGGISEPTANRFEFSVQKKSNVQTCPCQLLSH